MEMGSTMHVLRIHLLRKFDDRCNEQIEDGFDVHKKPDLLCYSSLLCVLAMLLWQEIITAHTKKNEIYALPNHLFS